MSKTYTVVKDGTELKELKALRTAKELADAEGAEVYCEGECVYPKAVVAPVEESHIVVEKPSQPDEGETKYRLTALMNVRKKPSMDAQILYTRAAGTEVRVLGIVNDWLHLTNDTYILYEGGKWAVKI
jgi:uncharacterized protein YgiM (DUF1202 family)